MDEEDKEDKADKEDSEKYEKEEKASGKQEEAVAEDHQYPQARFSKEYKQGSKLPKDAKKREEAMKQPESRVA